MFGWLYLNKHKNPLRSYMASEANIVSYIDICDGSW